MSNNQTPNNGAWEALQNIARKEKEEALKKYTIISELITEFGEEIPKDKVLTYLGFKSIDEMIDWELDYLPRRELNVKFEYQEKKIKIIKDAFEDEDLSIYEFF